MCSSKPYKTNSRNYLQVPRNPSLLRTPPLCQSLHVSKHPPVSCVSRHWQPYQGDITELSPTVWGVHTFSLFRPGEFSFVRWREKSNSWAKAGWVDQPGAPFCAQLIFFWGEYSGSAVFIISLWGWASCNIVMLMLQLISMQKHSGTATLSLWILKQKRCEWILSVLCTCRWD